VVPLSNTRWKQRCALDRHELVRAMRYFVPLMLLFWLWPLAELMRLSQPTGRAGGPAGGHPAAGRMDGDPHLRKAGACWRPRLAWRAGAWYAVKRAIWLITALRTQTPDGARIFSFNEAEHTQYAEHPL
jgi:hypothetical protein